MSRKSYLEKTRHMGAEEKETLIGEIERTAVDTERSYKGCARCVLYALQKHLGLANSDVPKAAIPLGAGIARSGNVCGALLGGLMAIGLVYGEDELDAKESPAYQEIMEHSIILYDRFKEEFGSVMCSELQEAAFGRSYNMRDTEDTKLLSELDEKADYPIIKKGARLAAEVILGDVTAA